MFKGVLEEHGGVKIIGMDTITNVEKADSGHLVLSASHGGTSAGSYGLKYPFAAVFFNDAGVGKDNAGIAALTMLEQAGIPGGTYSHMTARIGDVKDSWENGVISHVNEPARKMGFRQGDSVKEALRRVARAISKK
jgi:hypothetical protein